MRNVNGEIVTDTESDNPDDYVRISETTSEDVKALIRQTIQSRARRLRAKLVAQQRFLSSRISKKTSRISSECPDIGKTMEKFVEDHSVALTSGSRQVF